MSRIGVSSLAFLSFLVALLASSQPGIARQVQCLLEVKGVRYIDGPCNMDSFGSVATNDRGSFEILARVPGGSYFAYLSRDGASATGSWNADPLASHAQTTLGPLMPSEGCWLNASAKICAWKLGERHIIPGYASAGSAEQTVHQDEAGKCSIIADPADRLACYDALNPPIGISKVLPSSSNGKVAQIFRSEMLNAQVAYLESIIGPAMHVDPASEDGVEARQYRVDACNVTAYSKNQQALGYALDLTPACNFDLSNFLGSDAGRTDALTIGAFAASHGALHAQSSCIYSCGNAADPTVDFTYEGPHAENYINIVFTVTLAADGPLAAEDQWEKAMRAHENDDYIMNTKFNCEDKYDEIATRAFSSVKPDRITIGYGPEATSYARECKQ